MPTNNIIYFDGLLEVLIRIYVRVLPQFINKLINFHWQRMDLSYIETMAEKTWIAVCRYLNNGTNHVLPCMSQCRAQLLVFSGVLRILAGDFFSSSSFEYIISVFILNHTSVNSSMIRQFILFSFHCHVVYYLRNFYTFGDKKFAQLPLWNPTRTLVSLVGSARVRRRRPNWAPLTGCVPWGYQETFRTVLSQY